GQPHRLEAVCATRAGDAVPAEQYVFRAAVHARRRRVIGGCGKSLRRRLAVVAITSADDDGLRPGTHFDRPTFAMRDVCRICLRHGTRFLRGLTFSLWPVPG